MKGWLDGFDTDGLTDDRWMDYGKIDRWMDGLMGRWMKRLKDLKTEGWMD